MSRVTRYLLRMLILIVGVAGASLVYAQDAPLPATRMIIDNYDLMISLFPDDYPLRDSALAVCRTIIPAAESLQAFWNQQGSAVLYRMSQYAGIEWTEPSFDIFIVKYFPDYACHDPMIIPLTGKKSGDRIVALPQGPSHLLSLFQQLARRLLSQVFLPGNSAGALASHPLLQETPRRFDALADLLALTAIGDFADRDSILAVYRSPQWKKRAPGQDVLSNYLWKQWPLSPETTLAARLTRESEHSELVALTRPPEQTRPRRVGLSRLIGLSAADGRLGLAVTEDRSGYFRVTEMDTLKLAYAAGLRRGDLIRAVDGAAPRNIKELYTFLMDHLAEGVHISYLRGGQPGAVIIYP